MRSERAPQGVGDEASASGGLHPREVNYAVRSLLRALREGVRPGRKTTSSQLRELARRLEDEATVRDRVRRMSAVEHGSQVIVWDAATGEDQPDSLQGREALSLAESRWGPDVPIRVTVERVG